VEARTKGLSTACCATRQRLRHHTMVLFAEATHIDFGLIWGSIRCADRAVRARERQQNPPVSRSLHIIAIFDC
jgi:hypothetical protein